MTNTEQISNVIRQALNIPAGGVVPQDALTVCQRHDAMLRNINPAHGIEPGEIVMYLTILQKQPQAPQPQQAAPDQQAYIRQLEAQLAAAKGAEQPAPAPQAPVQQAPAPDNLGLQPPGDWLREGREDPQPQQAAEIPRGDYRNPVATVNWRDQPPGTGVIITTVDGQQAHGVFTGVGQGAMLNVNLNGQPRIVDASQVALA